MLDWLAPYCAANGTNWPYKMTNNSGEGIAGELPRCRIVYSWAALLFPSRYDTYSSIAEAGSAAEASYFAPFMRSSADFTRLFFFKSDDQPCMAPVVSRSQRSAPVSRDYSYVRWQR